MRQQIHCRYHRLARSCWLATLLAICTPTIDARCLPQTPLDEKDYIGFRAWAVENDIGPLSYSPQQGHLVGTRYDSQSFARLSYYGPGRRSSERLCLFSGSSFRKTGLDGSWEAERNVRAATRVAVVSASDRCDSPEAFERSFHASHIPDHQVVELFDSLNAIKALAIANSARQGLSLEHRISEWAHYHLVSMSISSRSTASPARLQLAFSLPRPCSDSVIVQLQRRDPGYGIAETIIARH